MSGWTPPGEPQPSGSSPPPAPPTWTPGQGPPPHDPPPAWASAAGWQPYAAPPAPKPGIVPLRPLGVGELLDGAFTLIRRHPRPTLGFAAIVMLAVETVQVLSNYLVLNGTTTVTTSGDLTATQTTDVAVRASVTGLVTFAVTGIAVLILTGIVTTVVGEAVLGRGIAPGQAWARLRPVFGRLLGVVLLTSLITAGLLLVGLIPGLLVIAGGGGNGGIALLVLGGLAAVAPAVYAWTSLSLAPAAVVLEGQRVVAALRRSRVLVRGSWWRVFGILLLTFVIGSIVSGIITVPFSIAAGGLTFFRTDGEANNLAFSTLVVSGLGGLLAGTVVRPFTAGVTALLYVDRRMRAEGLDITLQAASSSPTV